MKNRWLALCLLGLSYGAAVPAFAYTCPDGTYIDVACGSNCARYCSKGGASSRVNKESSSQGQSNNTGRARALDAIQGALQKWADDTDEKEQQEEQRRREQDILEREQKQREMNTKAEQERLKAEQERQEEKKARDDYDRMMDEWRGKSKGSGQPGGVSGKAPASDYSGQSCSFFTKPLWDEDRQRMNFYAEDSTVEYEGYVYQCKNTRWKRLGPKHVYPKVRNASVIEK